MASNRLPGIALGIGVLLILVGTLAFLVARSRSPELVIAATPTTNPVARGTSSVGPPVTLAVPTLPPSQPTTTPAPSPTPVPVPPPPPGATPGPSVVAAAPAPAAPPTSPPAPTAARAAPAAPATPTSPPTAPAKPAATSGTQATPPSPPPAATAPPSPTPFSGQVAAAGGLGNTRADVDAALGAPTGETPEHLVVFRRQNVEYRVLFVPDLNGRAAKIEEMPQQPLALDGAQAEARKLLPRDAQPPNAPAEGNDQFVVQRFTSQSLAAALDAPVFAEAQAEPGALLAVYVRDPAQQGRISRIVVGVGNDPSKLLR
jgi:hypothetical protein